MSFLFDANRTAALAEQTQSTRSIQDNMLGCGTPEGRDLHTQDSSLQKQRLLSNTQNLHSQLEGAIWGDLLQALVPISDVGRHNDGALRMQHST